MIVFTILLAGLYGLWGGTYANSESPYNSSNSSIETAKTASFTIMGVLIFVGLVHTIWNIVVFNVFLSFKRILQEGKNGDIEMK